MTTVRATTRAVRIYQDRYNELLDLSEKLQMPLHDALEIIFRRAERETANKTELEKYERKFAQALKRIKHAEEKAGCKLEDLV